MPRAFLAAVAVSAVVGSGNTFDTAADRVGYAARVRDMIDYSWSSYLDYGFPMDELTPLSCGGRDTWGSYVRAHPSNKRTNPLQQAYRYLLLESSLVLSRNPSSTQRLGLHVGG